MNAITTAYLEGVRLRTELLEGIDSKGLIIACGAE
jgi:hypothetical protein